MHDGSTRFTRWGLALAVLCLPAMAWARQARTDRFEITRSQGVVQQIKVHLAGQRQVLVLDRFTDIESFVEAERRKFSAPARQDPVCGALSDPQSCEQTCYWASKARPFGRARLLSASGRVQWRWQAGEQEAWRSLLSADTSKVPDGACLSPDGKHLATTAYFLDQGGDPSPGSALAGQGVVKLSSRFEVAEAVGRKTQEPFGHPRFTRFISWRADQPHTVVFEVTRPETDNQTVVDEGVAK
jgi:hypothetical protein